MTEPRQAAELSMAYNNAVRERSELRECSWIASEPIGYRVAVQIPDAEWQKLAAAICAITGGEVV